MERRSRCFGLSTQSMTPATIGHTSRLRYARPRLVKSKVIDANRDHADAVENKYDWLCCSDLPGVTQHDAALSTTNTFRRQRIEQHDTGGHAVHELQHRRKYYQ